MRNSISSALNPSFSVCIPSYNRGGILRQTLSQLRVLADLHHQCTGQLVEILCIDNASTDNTNEVCAYFESKYSFFNYIRNNYNIGLIPNIRTAIVSASSDYVWVLSDDDYPAPWCMSVIAKALEFGITNRLDFAYILSSMAYVDPAYQLLCQEKQKQLMSVCTPGSSILNRETIHGIALISRWVFTRKHWDDNYYNEIVTDDSLYTFLDVIIKSSLHCPGLLLSSPIAIASDRGSRSYYHPKTAIARVTEFPRIENMIISEYGFRKGTRMLSRERKNWMRDRLPFVFKLNVLRDEYHHIEPYLSKPISSLRIERCLLLAIRWLTDHQLIRRLLLKRYLKRRETI